jgi:hypothetical protein
MPGLLVFSLRLLFELLLAPLRAARGMLADRSKAPPPPPPESPPPEPPPARRNRPPRRRATPRQRATPRRAEPTRGEVAAMREEAREAETGGADSIGAEVHIAEPWPGYDDMRVDDVLARLQGASEVELAVVRAYERDHEARQAVLLAAGEQV